MADLLYQWPEAARFGRRIPKEKFYENARINAATKQRFVTEVARITWGYKLAETTINLPGTVEVPEVQVFTIESKADDVSRTVLEAIDKAIPFPIIFEVVRKTATHSEIRMTASHKQLGARTPKLSRYYSTGWMCRNTERQPLPTAITLPTLYAALLRPLTTLPSHPSEKMSELGDRLASAAKLEREIKRLERRLHAERQFNRKVELRRTLKMKQQELAILVS